MVDILDEAREAVQQEQMLALIKKYGSLIIMATVAGIIFIIGWQMWQASKRKAEYKTSVAYFDALEKLQSGDAEGGKAVLLAISKDAPKGYRSIAALQLAAQKVEAWKVKEALADYQAIEKNGDPAFRELATLLIAQLTDGPIENTAGVWRFSALELQGLKHLQAKQYAKARESFTKISTDPLSPQGLRQRAADLILYATYREDNAK